MSFTLKVRRSNANQISELAEFKIWQRITFVDNSTRTKQIFPLVTPLQSTAEKMQLLQIMWRFRTDRYVLYSIACYNALGITIDRDVRGEYYFQFKSDDLELPPLSTITKVEYSINQNFNAILSQLTFHSDYNFHKITNTVYDFFIQAEDNTRYYEKLLVPFATDSPVNTHKMVNVSLENIQLPKGYYQIDGLQYYFDKNKEVMPSHYIIKITI